MKRTGVVLGFLGVALATGLILSKGWRLVFAALALAGGGLFWAALFHVVPMALNARGFGLLVPRGRGRTFLRFLWLVWIRESVDGLLPVARVGGSVATTRLMVRGGLPLDLAVASLLVDTTISLGSQLLFLSLGLGLLAWRTPSWQIVRISLGVIALVPILIAFVLVQKAGPFRLGARALKALFGDRPLLEGGARLDRAVHRLYRRRRALLASSLFQLLGWIAGGGEIFLAMRFLGHPIPPLDSVVLAATVEAVSSAFFLVPAAAGVQEAGFLIVGPLLGIRPELALALSLARRVRDLVLFVPGLVAFQLDEARGASTLGEGAYGFPIARLQKSTRSAERRTSEE